MEGSGGVARQKLAVKSMKITIVRRLVQVFVLIFLNAAFWGSVLGANLSVFEVLFRFVPFISSPRSGFSNSGGFLELMMGSMVMQVVPFLLFGLIVLVTVVFGRVSCGWLCPAGFIQDIVGWAGKVTRNARPMGLDAHRFLSKVKTYILVLIMVFIVPGVFIYDAALYGDYLVVLGDFGKNPLGFWSMDEFFFVFVPRVFGNLASGSDGMAELLSNWAVLLQGFLFLVIVVLTFYYPRFYCRYMCPYGAISRPVAKFSIATLARNPAKCVGRKECGVCEDVCPMQVRILDDPYNRISGNGECVLCGKCMEVCPHGAVELGFFSG